jgi:hypothetical protein
MGLLALFRVITLVGGDEGSHIDPEKIIAGPNRTVTGPPYLKICHNTTDNQVRATKATETTIRLNLRIRLSYSCAQRNCWSLTDVRFAVPTNPLAFTHHLF